MEVKMGVKKDNTTKTVSIQSYRPASHAGLTPCAKRITPILTPSLTPKECPLGFDSLGGSQDETSLTIKKQLCKRF